MAKKKAANAHSEENDLGQEDQEVESGATRGEGHDQDVLGDAAEAIRRAAEELAKAGEWYEGVRQQAAEQVRQAREAKLGELVDGVLRFVRKHPGPGVILAMLVGFFLGRLFRR